MHGYHGNTNSKSLAHSTVINNIHYTLLTFDAHNLNEAHLHLTMCFSHFGHSCMNALYIKFSTSVQCVFSYSVPVPNHSPYIKTIVFTQQERCI